MMTNQYLKTLLQYDKDTGLFIWITNKNKASKGDIAGGLDEKGYVRIKIDGKKYRAHRLAIFYETGKWPIQVDHKNLNRSDNRFKNLRVADQSKNNMNRNVQSNNKLGFKGVTRNFNKFKATIKVGDKQLYLGNFNTPEQAHIAYAEAAEKYFGEFSRSGVAYNDE